MDRKKVEQHIMEQLTEEQDELLSLRGLLKKQNEEILRQKEEFDGERNKFVQDKAETEEMQKKNERRKTTIKRTIRRI